MTRVGLKPLYYILIILQLKQEAIQLKQEAIQIREEAIQISGKKPSTDLRR